MAELIEDSIESPGSSPGSTQQTGPLKPIGRAWETSRAFSTSCRRGIVLAKVIGGLSLVVASWALLVLLVSSFLGAGSVMGWSAGTFMVSFVLFTVMLLAVDRSG